MLQDQGYMNRQLTKIKLMTCSQKQKWQVFALVISKSFFVQSQCKKKKKVFPFNCSGKIKM